MTARPIVRRLLPLLTLPVLLLTCPDLSGAAEGPTRLLRRPTLSAAHVAFEYANDIWVAPRTGGEARRLTSG